MRAVTAPRPAHERKPPQQNIHLFLNLALVAQTVKAAREADIIRPPFLKQFTVPELASGLAGFVAWLGAEPPTCDEQTAVDAVCAEMERRRDRTADSVVHRRAARSEKHILPLERRA
jgi:hypothetical protein